MRGRSNESVGKQEISHKKASYVTINKSNISGHKSSLSPIAKRIHSKKHSNQYFQLYGISI